MNPIGFRIAAMFLLSILIGACARQRSSGSEAKEPGTPLFEDLGSHHHAVTTSSEIAQKYFDQGLRLVYGFKHDEAERAFREAARIDPNLRDGMVGRGVRSWSQLQPASGRATQPEGAGGRSESAIPYV